MISPAKITPDSLLGRILTVIVEADEPPNLATVAGIVCPIPFPATLATPGIRQRRGTPWAEVTAHLAARAAVYTAWTKQGEAAARRVSRQIGYLTEAGLVRELVPPHASDAWWSLRTRFSRTEALARLAIRDEDEVDDPEEEEDEEQEFPTVIEDATVPTVEDDFLPLPETLMARVELRPASVLDLLGPKPSGQQKRIYARLRDMGAIIAPMQRQATPTGKALVSSWYP